VKPTYFTPIDCRKWVSFFFDIADTLAGQALSRDVAVSEITKTPAKGSIETKYRSGEAPLHIIQILKIIRDIKTYRGHDYATSRKNVETIAHLGGFAAYGIYDLMPPDGFNFETLGAFRNSFITVHAKMGHAFRGTVRPITKDRDVSRYIDELGNIVRGT